ncbi:MAG: 23S rRNA (pseudouridine(1915)-N(3))-methyltransferase RlmH [Clostridiales bacterium]|nr:23S rRNA (pseudouridine(1915)-N(3))-methyltransferase RlmH [Clostridiales bacterium]MDY4143560.1 23S rRNA (pseudouridine(1915)-N(3))-methyltransferase RlmH [Oscillospiraceae bacterium]
MLNMRIVCVGKLREQFYIDAFNEYSKRLSAYCKFECVELNETKLGSSPSDKEIAAALDKEAVDIERALGKDAYVIAMCVEGKQLKSEDFAQKINSLAVSGRGRICFVIGGSFGISQRIKQRADMRLSMSEMTFPHHLARVMLAEQIYRAFKIIKGSKYHK